MAVLVLLVARDRAHALLDLFRVEQVELSQKTFQRRQPMRVIAPPIVIAAMRPFPLSDFGDEQVAQLVEPVHPGLRHSHGGTAGPVASALRMSMGAFMPPAARRRRCRSSRHASPALRGHALTGPRCLRDAAAAPGTGYRNSSPRRGSRPRWAASRRTRLALRVASG